MPWRVSPQDRARGVMPDPYRVWLSEVMLQQTTVAAVRAYFQRFTVRWPTVSALAAAPDAEVMAEWAGLGYYARARNLLACAREVANNHMGVFPQTLAGLRALPGVGPYTAAAISSIAFDHAETVVDGNVERVMSRLFAVQTPLPQAKAELTALAASLTPAVRAGDYAQAVMDLGATICTPRNPLCALCPLSKPCKAAAMGIQATLPRKLAKPVKPTRTGTVWAAFQRDGRVLVEDRPAKGLLGGMIGLPGTEWDGCEYGPPLALDWISVGEIKHTFTHFHLILRVMVGQVSGAPNPERGRFVADINPRDFPTLMQKAYDLAKASEIGLQSKVRS